MIGFHYRHFLYQVDTKEDFDDCTGYKRSKEGKEDGDTWNWLTDKVWKNIPHICQFWYTIALIACKGTPKSAQIRDKILNQNRPKQAKIQVSQAQKYTGLKKHTTIGAGGAVADYYEL